MRFTLVHQTARQRAMEAVMTAPDGWVVLITEPKRTLAQNAKFHAICSGLEHAGVEWAGRPRTAAQWKALLVSGHAVATGSVAELVNGLEGEFVSIRESTASMGKSRGSSLIEYALAWCVLHGIEVNDAANY